MCLVSHFTNNKNNNCKKFTRCPGWSIFFCIFFSGIVRFLHLPFIYLISLCYTLPQIYAPSEFPKHIYNFLWEKCFFHVYTHLKKQNMSNAHQTSIKLMKNVVIWFWARSVCNLMGLEKFRGKVFNNYKVARFFPKQKTQNQNWNTLGISKLLFTRH